MFWLSQGSINAGRSDFFAAILLVGVRGPNPGPPAPKLMSECSKGTLGRCSAVLCPGAVAVWNCPVVACALAAVHQRHTSFMKADVVHQSELAVGLGLLERPEEIVCR